MDLGLLPVEFGDRVQGPPGDGAGGTSLISATFHALLEIRPS